MKLSSLEKGDGLQGGARAVLRLPPIEHKEGSLLDNILFYKSNIMSKKPVKWERNAIQEWVKWLVLTAGVFLIDGGIFTLKFPYGTFPFSDAISGYLGPVIAFGPTNATGDFRLAPVVAVTGPTIPLIGILAIIGALLCILIESDYIEAASAIHKNNLTKASFYGFLGLMAINQLTCVQPATGLLIASSLLVFDYVRSTSKTVLPK